MAVTIKSLIIKNKEAFDSKYYIESLNLSYILINKALKQIVNDTFGLEILDSKIKTNGLIKEIKKGLKDNPSLKTSVSKKLMNDVDLFLNLFKAINKELKFQFPEKKIVDAANLGINCIVILNTTLIKIKNNKIS